MKRTVKRFLANESSETHKNIDRLEHNMPIEGSARVGQLALLKIQKEHLDLLETLQSKVHSYDELEAICENKILENEDEHRKIAYKEIPASAQHSAEWWNTLHLMQFWSDFLNRVKAWERTYA